MTNILFSWYWKNQW